MINYSNLNAVQILEKIMADGLISSDEIKALKQKLDEDWVVDRPEVELLFKVNQSLGDRDEKCEDWLSFFVDNVSRLSIMDLSTPGEIDQSEGDWLADLLDQNGVNNASETALLTTLARDAKRISGRISERLSGK